ncbi:uncharacterized protein LOC110975309 [Acanthaster planci]|uniref:Uncharacterized protein LOC110975309 n=1 Tax=Acanthaster planci TaxID=133434 RepID=A0A8B7XTZ2_ACAPL|nr:uncharacterized protein LOC110975309 [Acanthaster planci]
MPVHSAATTEDRQSRTRAFQERKMAKRFVWGSEQVEEFFSLLRNSYGDYLMAKELRRMDEFYDMLGSCIGADGLVVQNFLKKTGRAYRDILLQAETCEEGAKPPERKLRGSVRVYDLYEEYYQMYYLGSVPRPPEDAEAPSASFQQKRVTSHHDRKRKHFEDAPACKRRIQTSAAELDIKEENFIRVDYEEVADPADGDPDSGPHLQATGEALHLSVVGEASDDATCKRAVVENGVKVPECPQSVRSNAKSGTRQGPEEPGSDAVFGPTTDFQERFLKLMENQNHILASIVDELNMIKHALLDAHGLQTITYVK